MELNIEALRKERRPLWMTGLGVESPADLLGGGGIFTLTALQSTGNVPLVKSLKTWKKPACSWRVATWLKIIFHQSDGRPQFSGASQPTRERSQNQPPLSFTHSQIACKTT
jgi:hypothetical protein